MSEWIKTGIKVIWLIVLVQWTLSAVFAKRREGPRHALIDLLLYWLPLIVALLLLGPGEWYGHSWLRENFVAHTDRVGMIALAIAVAGGFVACWSRYVLGRNWSLTVQRKQGHQLVQHGPYSIIRHPIYTGLLLLFTGNALIVGDYRAILAVVIVLLSFWLKIRNEETLMAATFGAEYDTYRRRTKALVPFLL